MCMTDRRDLKRRVRERQERTGESYMVALRHVLAQAQPQPQPPGPSAIPTVEVLDLTEVGAALGIQCRIAMYPELAERVEPGALLRRLRDVLLATADDRDLALMRRVVLQGENPRINVTQYELEDGRRLVARARAGLGGVSESGRMLALPVAGRRTLETVLFLISLMPPFVPSPRPPMLLVTTLDGIEIDPVFGWGAATAMKVKVKP
jgi:hypothetical protein